jgi:UBX domain-containing protein 1
MADKKDITAQFIELSQAPVSVAEALLERNKYDLELALEEFYNGPTHRTSAEPPKQEQQGPFEAQSSGGTTSSSSRNSSAAPKAGTATGKQSRFKSFQELVNGSGDDQDDEQNFFAGGGDGSAINVENPNAGPRNLVQDLLRKAEQGGGHPDRAQESEGSSSPGNQQKFDGVGYKLGDSATPSSQVGSKSYAPKKLEKAVREITFWKDGFQVGDGKLYRYDDPANATYLSELNSGRAPLSLLNVEYGQDVDVNVLKKLDEDFKPPKKKIGGFHGQGQRLGSPISPDYEPPKPESPKEEKREEVKQEQEEEKQEGDASVQIRLADGRRIVRKFQSTAPVETIYAFVKAETIKTTTREFTLNYAFPVKSIDDLEQSIKDAGLVNSVVVQRWI